MKKIFFALACGVCVFAGCSKDRVEGESIRYKEYLIDTYIAPEQLEIVHENTGVWLSMSGPQYNSWSTGVEYTEFLRLAALHGGRIDREISIAPNIYYAGRVGYACYSENFTSMNVTCDQPWDDAHPAGSSLNEFAIVTFYTFAPFVRNGNSGHGVVERYKRLDQLEAGDLDMIAHGTLRVLLPEKSHYSVRHTFTIWLTTASGRTLSTTWDREPTP